VQYILALNPVSILAKSFISNKDVPLENETDHSVLLSIDYSGRQLEVHVLGRRTRDCFKRMHQKAITPLVNSLR